MVDPAEAKVRFSVKDLVHGQLDAIYRGTGALPCFNALKDGDLMQTEGYSYGNSMPHSGLGFVRGYYHYFPQVLHSFHQIPDARGGYTIVISDEDDRPLIRRF
jgi:hypothetical protein